MDAPKKMIKQLNNLSSIKIITAWGHIYVTVYKSGQRQAVNNIVDSWGYLLGDWGYTLDGCKESWTAVIMQK